MEWSETELDRLDDTFIPLVGPPFDFSFEQRASFLHDYFKAQARFVQRLGKHQLSVGTMQYFGNQDQNLREEVLIQVRRTRTPTGIIAALIDGGQDLRFQTYYLSDIWNPHPALTIEGALFYDTVEDHSLSSISLLNPTTGADSDFSRVSPRLGLAWRATDHDTLRMAAFNYVVPFVTDNDAVFLAADRDDYRMTLGIRHVRPDGWSGGVRQIARKIDLKGGRKDEYVLSTDLDFAYEFPEKRGRVRFEMTNVFDSHYNFVVDPITLNADIPARQMRATLEINFWPPPFPWPEAVQLRTHVHQVTNLRLQREVFAIQRGARIAGHLESASGLIAALNAGDHPRATHWPGTL